MKEVRIYWPQVKFKKNPGGKISEDLSSIYDFIGNNRNCMFICGPRAD